jgi:hypothetical protein
LAIRNPVTAVAFVRKLSRFLQAGRQTARSNDRLEAGCTGVYNTEQVGSELGGKDA